MRLDRLLANLGYGSRREVKALVGGGLVSIDGEVVRNESLSVAMSGAVPAVAVLVQGEPLDQPGRLTIAMHKPLGRVCSHDDREGPSVYELLPQRWRVRNPRVESVGRLDRDTSGLLILSDDHQLVHRLTSPKHHVAKRYVATLDVPCPPDAATVFSSGQLVLQGESTPCRPSVAFDVVSASRNVYALTITEGRYHQIRRMFAAIGCQVLELHRTHVGQIALGDLAAGEVRILDDDSVGVLVSQ